MAGSQARDLNPAPVTAQGEEMVRNGQPVRFWGINVNLQPWHTNESIDKMVDRIAAVGFNAVRLWPNWKTFYGSDVRNSKLTPKQGFAFQDYKPGDGSQLDLFDRFLYRCWERGISVYMTSLAYYPPIYTTVGFVDMIPTSNLDRTEWISAMKGSRWEKGVYDPWWVLHYLDERLQAVWLKHADLFLDHVNKYTGIRNADDNNIVMWQLHNESKFISEFMLNNKYRISDPHYRPFPRYFQKKLKSKFNEFLTRKYGRSDALVKAWGKLRNGESLEAMTVDAGVRDAQNIPYEHDRASDFTEFVLLLVKDWNTRFIAHARSHAQDSKQGIGVAPIATDTFGWTNPAHFASVYDGSMVAFGNYPDPEPRGRDTDEPQKLFLRHSGAWGPLDFARPFGKPAVIYETNYNRFALYDAELPWLLATFASWQNINGVFFYFWNAPAPEELPGPYGKNVFAYRGHEIWGDETYTAAIQAAGDAYLHRLLPAASNPTVFSYRRELASDPDWYTWDFHQRNPSSQPDLKGLSLGQAKQLMSYMQGTAFVHGARTRVSENQTEDMLITGSLFPTAMGGDFRPSQDLYWQGSSGHLWINRPTIKAFVGYLTGNRISWSGGFSIVNLNPEELGAGEGHRAFVAVSIISLDGQPLAESQNVRVNAISHSYHKGMIWRNARGGSNSGEGPVVVRRVSGRLSLPFMAGRKAVYRNFALKIIRETAAEDSVSFSSSEPIYDILLQTD